MRHRSSRRALLSLGLLIVGGCAAPGIGERAEIEAPQSVAVGESLGLRATGLAPGELYTFESAWIDVFERRWVSRADFRADALGTVDVARQAPEAGDYSGIDEFGLLWSAVMPEPPAEDWRAPEPKQYNEIHARLQHQGAVLAERTVRQWVRPSEVSTELLGPELVGELFLPAERSAPLPALVFLGGSGGGRGWATRMAGLVARQGFAALALAYFNAEGLAEHLARYPTVSSWSLGGQDLAFVPNAYDKKFFETFDGMYLWYRTLAQHEAVAAAAIPVERIQGDLLLLSGVEDRIWPASYMAEQIVARLYLEEFPHRVKHLSFPDAGHGIAAPPGEPTTSVATRLGGSPAGNAAARAQGWRAIREFLSASLG